MTKMRTGKTKMRIEMAYWLERRMGQVRGRLCSRLQRRWATEEILVATDSPSTGWLGWALVSYAAPSRPASSELYVCPRAVFSVF